MDVGLEMFIFMGVILKIPVLAACWLIWHAVRAEPDPVAGSEDAGGERGRFRREPKPKRPRGPRRGPHAPDALPLPCPVDSETMRVTRRPAHAALTGSAERRQLQR